MKKRLQASHGRKRGAEAGYAHGYAFGRREAVLRSTASELTPRLPYKLLFVLENSPGFHSIDRGIASALPLVCKEWQIAGPYDDLTAIVKETRPDAVLVLNAIHSWTALQPHIASIRSSGVPCLVWFADDPYFTDMTSGIAPEFDAVFTHEASCVEFYKEVGCRSVHYLPFAGSPEVFTPTAVGLPYRTDICFVGMPFWNRAILIDAIAPFLAEKKTLIAGAYWDSRLARFSLLKNSIRLQGIQPAETARFYSGTKIVINIHRGHDTMDNPNSRKIPARSVNPRTFDICSAGAFQLTDVREDLPAFYTPGVDVATFHTAEELLHKLDYYLRNEAERECIALSGLERTRREHTYAKRLVQLLNLSLGGTVHASGGVTSG
ncbi:CgeB family protein [Paenibacillus sp. y28]|uniref:CgeB family protein n=1 Tax=Paenibacillus sp. y28 TaxID=3129110 RepID=UPI00301A8DAB